MQIAPGQVPLSVAILKALGTQAATPATVAKATAAPAAAGPAVKAPVAAPDGTAAAGRNLPRGSFVDLRV